MYLTDSFQREVIHSSGGCESSKNKIKDMNINWWIRNIGPNYCISEFKCDLNSNRFSSKRCLVFRVIIILYTNDLYVVFIPQSESKWNKIVSIQTMSNLKILCLPPIAITLRDLDMRFTWVYHVAASVVSNNLICNMTIFWESLILASAPPLKSTQRARTQAFKLKSSLICFISIAALPICKISAKNINNCLSYCKI